MSFAIVADWNARCESADTLAARAIVTLQRLACLDPAFGMWFIAERDQRFSKPMQIEPASLERWIARGISKERDGTPAPIYGYLTSAFNFPGMNWSPLGFRFCVNAGSYAATPGNVVSLVSDFDGSIDPSLATLDVMAGALAALAEPFEASCGVVYPHSFCDRPRRSPPPRLDLAWITYLAPRFTHLVTPPPTAIVERRPDGGLLMAATGETFDIDNPAHMGVARDIQAVLAPFNDLPYPQEDHV